MSAAQKYSIQQLPATQLVQRAVQTGSFNGSAIEVVTGYDIAEDRFPVHVYVTAADGIRRKLPLGELHGASEREAFLKGWADVDAFFCS